MSKNVNKTSSCKRKPQQGLSATPKHNRKSFHKLSESSSLSSNRNSSAQSEDGEGGISIYTRQQHNHNHPFEDATKKHQSQVRELRSKLRVLEECVDNKDVSLSAVTREKDRAVGEVRRLERNIKQLKQQLKDERNYYLEEKEKFCAEMSKYKRKLQDIKKGDQKWTSPLKSMWERNSSQKGEGDFNSSKTQFRRSNSIESLHLYGGDDATLQVAALRTENAKLHSIISERDERNYELCLRFLRMKHCKNDLKTRFQDLENEYLQVISNLMEKIDEARQEFNFIADQKFKKPLHSTNAAYLQLVQRNSKMACENASLRLNVQSLRKELGKYMIGVGDFGRSGNLSIVEEEPVDSQEDLKSKKTKKNVNFKELRTIFENDLAFKTSDTDSNYMSKTSTTDPSSGSLGEPKSNESIVEMPKNAIMSNDVLQRIFQKEETSSTSSGLPYEKRTRREKLYDVSSKEIHSRTHHFPYEGCRNEKETNTCCDEAENKDKKIHSEPSKKTEKSLLPPFQSRTRLNEGKISYLNQSWEAKIPKKNSVEIQVGGTNGELILFSPRQTCHHKRDVCGLQQRITDSSDFGGSHNKNKDRTDDRSQIQEFEEDDGKMMRALQIYSQDSIHMSHRNDVSLHDELMEATKTQMTTDDDPFWKREMNLHSLLTKNSTKSKIRHDENKCKAQMQSTKIPQPQSIQCTRLANAEAKHKFSQKLMATAPEKLKTLLTEQGCYQVAPVIVQHDARSIIQRSEQNNEIILQLFQSVSGKNSSRHPAIVQGAKKLNIPEKPSDLLLPLSNLPTSNSTMEMTGSSVSYNSSAIVMRTLSAPGLLESEWLDSFRKCEMKDSSTNT